MAWEWSYTQEGLAIIDERISRMKWPLLREIYAEIIVHSDETLNESDPDDYWKAEMKTQKKYEEGKLAGDVVVSEIQGFARRQATCENGGHRAWVCPFGCGPHLVSLDPIGEVPDSYVVTVEFEREGPRDWEFAKDCPGVTVMDKLEHQFYEELQEAYRSKDVTLSGFSRVINIEEKEDE